MAVVTRWERKVSALGFSKEHLMIDGKKVLECIVLGREESGELALPGVGVALTFLGPLLSNVRKSSGSSRSRGGSGGGGIVLLVKHGTIPAITGKMGVTLKKVWTRMPP
jgi:hypothetical protein